MTRRRFEAGILSVAAGCQAVTRGGEPLPAHEARLPGLHTCRWSRAGGDEPLARELSRILHRGCPLAGVPRARWSFRPTWVGGRFVFGAAARALEIVGGASNDECVLSCLGPRQAVGAVRHFGTFSWMVALSWPVRASFGSEELSVASVRSWAFPPPKRGEVRMSACPGAKSIPLCFRSSGSLAGVSQAVAFRFFFPLRLNRSEGWSLPDLAAVGLRILRA
jgi:hypothetical protein